MNFTNSKGETSKNTKAVLAVCTSDPGTGFLKCFGTAFYISGNGILLTARHNLFDNEGNHLNNMGVIHILPTGEYLIRPIKKTFFDESDIACMLPQAIMHKGQPFFHETLVLSRREPDVGEQLGMFGYPNSVNDVLDDVSKINLYPNSYEGKMIEYLPNGSSKLNNPCYLTSIQIDHGASGGPVFDKDGKVFGVCSSGYNLAADEEPLSYVTPVRIAFHFNITDDSNETKTIAELIEMGIIEME